MGVLGHHAADDHVVQGHDAREVGDVGGEGTDVMEAASDADGDRQLGVVVLDHDLTRAEELEVQSTAQTSLVDVGEQRVHVGLAGQLLFELLDVLLDLDALLAQLGQVDGLGHLGLVLALELGLLVALGLELVALAGQQGHPAQDHDDDDGQQEARQLGQQGPLARLVGVEAAELALGLFEQRVQIDVEVFGHGVLLRTAGQPQGQAGAGQAPCGPWHRRVRKRHQQLRPRLAAA